MSMYIKNITENSFEAWFLNRYEQDAINGMASYGVEVCGELTYYTNTSQLYERFQSEIWQMATRHSASGFDDNLQLTLARGDDTASPERFTTNMVQAAAAYLASKYQQDMSDQTTDLTHDDEADDEDHEQQHMDWRAEKHDPEGLTEYLIVVGEECVGNLEDFFLKHNIQTHDDLSALSNQLGKRILICTPITYPRDASSETP